MNADDRGGVESAGRPAPEADALWAGVGDGSAGEANGWGEYMLTAEGMRIAVGLWERRAEALASYVAEHGANQSGWATAHPPTVLRTASVAHAACLGCSWLGDSCDPDDAHDLHRLRWAAQEHSIRQST